MSHLLAIINDAFQFAFEKQEQNTKFIKYIFTFSAFIIIATDIYCTKIFKNALEESLTYEYI